MNFKDPYFESLLVKNLITLIENDGKFWFINRVLWCSKNKLYELKPIGKSFNILYVIIIEIVSLIKY